MGFGWLCGWLDELRAFVFVLPMQPLDELLVGLGVGVVRSLGEGPQGLDFVLPGGLLGSEKPGRL